MIGRPTKSLVFVLTISHKFLPYIGLLYNYVFALLTNLDNTIVP